MACMKKSYKAYCKDQSKPWVRHMTCSERGATYGVADQISIPSLGSSLIQLQNWLFLPMRDISQFVGLFNEFNVQENRAGEFIGELYLPV
jgi:hypothetical protein